MGRYLVFIVIVSLTLGLFLLRFGPGPTFIEGVVGRPVDLNPAFGPKNEIDGAIEALLFRSLFKYDSSGKIIGDLAQSFKVKDGGKVYEITLKEGSFWQDDHPIVADDVKFTFSQDPIFAEAAGEEEVEIEVVTEKIIRFKLKDPLSSFPSLLTRPIVPSHPTGTDSPFAITGSGGFRVQRVKRNGVVSEIILQNLGGGEVKNLVIKFFQTQAELEEAAKRGEVDAFVSESFNHPSFTKYTAPLYGRYFAIFFNLESKNRLVKSSAFREAAARKTPVTMLVDEILKGGESAVRGPMSGTWAEAKLPFPEFSPTLQGGFKGKIILMVPDVGKLPEVAEAVAQNWRKLGVGVTVALISPTALEEIISSRNFEAIILGQEVSRDPDRYSLWHSTQKDYPGLNITSYADLRADRALEEGRKASGGAERKQHYSNFQRLFLEDNPAIFLYHPSLNYFVSRKFTGIDPTPIFISADRFWNIQEWKLLR